MKKPLSSGKLILLYAACGFLLGVIPTAIYVFFGQLFQPAQTPDWFLFYQQLMAFGLAPVCERAAIDVLSLFGHDHNNLSENRSELIVSVTKVFMPLAFGIITGCLATIVGVFAAVIRHFREWRSEHSKPKSARRRVLQIAIPLVFIAAAIVGIRQLFAPETYVTPAVSGKVVDEAGHPISNVLVMYQFEHIERGPGDAITRVFPGEILTSDAQGDFHIPQRQFNFHSTDPAELHICAIYSPDRHAATVSHGKLPQWFPTQSTSGIKYVLSDNSNNPAGWLESLRLIDCVISISDSDWGRGMVTDDPEWIRSQTAMARLVQLFNTDKAALLSRFGNDPFPSESNMTIRDKVRKILYIDRQ